MVVILSQTVVALYLHFRHKDRFLVTKLEDRDREPAMGSFPDGLQEAILRLSGAATFEQLEEAVRESLELILPNVSDVVLYLQPINNQLSQELFCSQGLLHALPKEGLPWEAAQRRERLIVPEVDASDPLSGLLKSTATTSPRSASSSSSSSRRDRRVVCTPAVDRENERVIAVLVAACTQPSPEHLNCLSLLERQLLVCHKRLKQSSQILTSPTPLQSTPNNVAHKDKNHHAPILTLCAELYDHDAASLQIKVIKHLAEQTQAESGFILLVDSGHREFFCQVIGNIVLKEEIRFPIEYTSFAGVLKTKSTLKLEDIEQEKKQELERKVGCSVNSLLCVPVCSQGTGDVIAIACMINKKNAERFTESDVEAIVYCFKYTATVLHSTLAVQNERRLKHQTEALLQVTKNLFTHLDDLTTLLREIMQEARNLTKAERCSVFLLERETNELVAKVFDGDIKGGSQKPQTEVRIPANQGIAGHVNTTGQLLNIDDAYSHPLFYRRVDELTGFKTRNVLCFPIKDENDKIVGVAQLCNKINGGGFSKYDEEIAQAFSVYCCISIVNTLLYKKVQDAQHRSRVSNELMIYHMQVPSEEVTPVAEAPILPPASINPEMHLFRFTPRTIGYDDTLLAVHAMMDDMGFITKYRIQRNSLAKFVLMTRKGYRDPPYHNWHHAFAVAHFCYLLYKNVNLLNYLDEIEIFSLFVASLCHDIDHRGTNNSYQVASGSVLAALYSSEGSVLERHHLAQTMCILNTEGCNIFENLSRTDYQRALDLVRDIILATDLAHHLRILKDLKKMADEGYSKSNPAHRTLLLCLAMTSCDLSDQTKHWRNSKKIAEAIYNEFFSQGDLEKALGRKPMLMMDREKAYIPDLQIDFLNCIALPVFRLLTQVFPAASEVLDAVESNKRNWLRMNEKRQQLQNIGGNSMDIFDIQLEDENKT